MGLRSLSDDERPDLNERERQREREREGERKRVAVYLQAAGLKVHDRIVALGETNVQGGPSDGQLRTLFTDFPPELLVQVL